MSKRKFQFGNISKKSIIIICSVVLFLIVVIVLFLINNTNNTNNTPVFLTLSEYVDKLKNSFNSQPVVTILPQLEKTYNSMEQGVNKSNLISTHDLLNELLDNIQQILNNISVSDISTINIAYTKLFMIDYYVKLANNQMKNPNETTKQIEVTLTEIIVDLNKTIREDNGLIPHYIYLLFTIDKALSNPNTTNKSDLELKFANMKTAYKDVSTSFDKYVSTVLESVNNIESSISNLNISIILANESLISFKKNNNIN